MDYIQYVTTVVVLLGAVLLAIRLAGKRHAHDRQMKLADRARKRRARQARSAQARPGIGPRQKAVLQRQLKNVPTPWGWPGSITRPAAAEGHPMRSPGIQLASGGLQRWIDQLMAEKRTVDDREYLESRHAALRSMIEDRFGRSPQPQEMAYRKVKPPRLMDPERPHDQMDNFPSGKTERIVSGLKQLPDAARPMQSALAARRSASLGDIKTPWGW